MTILIQQYVFSAMSNLANLIKNLRITSYVIVISEEKTSLAFLYIMAP